jgi:hypothetical protein
LRAKIDMVIRANDAKPNF